MDRIRDGASVRSLKQGKHPPPARRPVPTICFYSFLCSKAAHVIHEMPHLLRPDPRFTIESSHRGAEAVADVDENFPLGGSVIPFVVRQIRRFWFSRLREFLSLLAIATPCRAVTIRTQAVIKPLASSKGFRSGGDGIL